MLNPLLALTALLVAAPTARQEPRVTATVEVVELCRAAVVNVAATHVVTDSASPFDFFETPRERKQSSVGSGSIIHPAGYVLTNAHVIAAATELTVTMASGKTWPAHVVASLPEEDIAIVKIDLPHHELVPALVLGRSDDVMVGESVIAIGNPVGLGHTVTTGIISATQRELAPRPNVKMTGLLQTDAAINPGNSGGPLLNVLGEQIGVNTAIRGDAQNVGFAIGVDRVRALLPRLLAVENRTRAADGARLSLGLGLAIQIVNDEEVLVVKEVSAGSPAARARIEKGSVVVGVSPASSNGEAEGTIVSSLIWLYETEPGEKVQMRLRLPEGSVDVVELSPRARPPPDGLALAKDRLGLVLADLDPATAVRLGLRGGVVVKASEGPAKQAGIAVGDLVVRLGDYGLRGVQQLSVLEDLKAGDRVSLRVVRLSKGRVFAAEVVLPARF